MPTMTTAPDHHDGRPFDAVLCDLDGVIRHYDTSRVTELERASGLPEGSTAERAFAPGNGLPLLLGELTKEQWVDALAHDLSARVPPARARALSTAFAEAESWIDECVVDQLRRARASLPVVIVTNAAPWLDDDLAALGLTDLADHVVSSARVGVAKPDRRIYEMAAARAGVSPDRCLFVDDARENVAAAVALGMTGVHYREPADLRRALAVLTPPR
ncbi:HAD family hydrolase [Streptomyces eurocidicus]|nr:HAD family phosphatase [Streptomyces eurocidicus]MBB5122404.1 putative hydrolase of the HAD superfamily [Streptomyces eurocidicus]